jgi:hypothetical protein
MQYMHIHANDHTPSTHKEIVMINKPTNSLGRLLLLGSAAFLVHAGSALGADRADDPQAQARELLAGTAKGSPVATAIALPAAASQAAVEPQEQARRLILGTPHTRTLESYAALPSKTTSSSDAERRGIRRVFPDGQALAERMITGAAG